MPQIGPLEIVMVLVVALLVFGPKKLPEVGKQAAKGLREFRRFQSGVTDDLKGILDADETTSTSASVDAPEAAADTDDDDALDVEPADPTPGPEAPADADPLPPDRTQ